MKTMTCECGCGGEGFFNQMVEVKKERAVDETLLKRVTERTFLVLSRCREPFEEELALMELLQQLVVAMAPRGRRWSLLRYWFVPSAPYVDLHDYCLRFGRAVQVMRLQHGIYERTRGYEYARRRALRSGILFASPRFLQGFISKRFTKALAAEEKKKMRQIAPLEGPGKTGDEPADPVAESSLRIVER